MSRKKVNEPGKAGRIGFLPEKATFPGLQASKPVENYSASILISKQLAIWFPLRYVPVIF